MSKTLYERLGGEKGISAIATDLIKNHLKNPKIMARFQDTDPIKMHSIVVDFFGMGTGGPQKYTGKDMKAAHKGMNISEEEFIAVLDDSMAALEKNNVPQDVKNEVLGILYSMKSEIVRV